MRPKRYWETERNITDWLYPKKYKCARRTLLNYTVRRFLNRFNRPYRAYENYRKHIRPIMIAMKTNHTYNRITFDNTETYNTVKNLVKTESEGFDFNKIIPQPKGIYLDGLGENYLGANDRIAHPLNWYDWNIAHWGTKWNAYNVKWNDEVNEVVFFTAWSTPMPIISQLAEMFENSVFVVHSEDAGCGFSYLIKCSDGVMWEAEDVEPEYYEPWEEEYEEEEA